MAVVSHTASRLPDPPRLLRLYDQAGMLSILDKEKTCPRSKDFISLPVVCTHVTSYCGHCSALPLSSHWLGRRLVRTLCEAALLNSDGVDQRRPEHTPDDDYRFRREEGLPCLWIEGRLL